MSRAAALLLLLVLLPAASAFAQDTPTPTPTLPPAFSFEPLAFDAVPSPTLIPTIVAPDLVATYAPDFPTNNVLNYLATANANLEDAPADLTNNGVALVPNQNGSQLFSYAKWIMSASTASEIFGPFGVIAVHVATVVSLVIFLVVVYFIIFVAVYIIRFVVWLVRRFLEAIEAIPFFG